MGGNGVFGTFSGSHPHVLPAFSSPRQRSLASLTWGRGEGGGIGRLVVVTRTPRQLARLRGNGHLQV